MTARGEEGYTLVELLVVMSVSLVVLFATLGVFDAFSKSTAASDRLTQSQDAARTQLDRITELLRSARPRTDGGEAVIIPASGYGGLSDLTFTTYAGAGTANRLHAVRLCVNTTTRTLWRETLDDASGYVSPGASCPSAAGGWARATLVTNVANTAAVPLFALDSARRSLDIDLVVDGRTAGQPLALRSSAFLRLPTLSSTAAGPVSVQKSCNGVVATLSVVGTTASATFKGTLSNGAQVTLGTGTSIVVSASTPTVVTPIITNASGVVQTLSAMTVLCP